MKVTDLHIHTNYSPDSCVPMEDYCIKAIKDGVDIITFTDHIECNDICNCEATFNGQRYVDDIARLQDKYSGKLTILSGVEFGEPHNYPYQFEKVTKLNLDLIMASVHYPNDLQYAGRIKTLEEVYEMHYKETLLAVRLGGFEVLGHLDFPRKFNKDFFIDDPIMINEILTTMVSKGIIPEVNTSALRRGLSQPLPRYDILDKYVSLGGKHITINSDSHECEHLATNFHNVASKINPSLKNCYFIKRKLIENI